MHASDLTRLVCERLPLAHRYHAPAMCGWMEIPGGSADAGGHRGSVTALAGPVFEWISGDHPVAVRGDLRHTLIDALQRLHADEHLRAELRARGSETVSCARASVLDWIIDPLADWIEAAHEPLHGEAVRDNNRRVHQQALALYRERYGS